MTDYQNEKCPSCGYEHVMYLCGSWYFTTRPRGTCGRPLDTEIFLIKRCPQCAVDPAGYLEVRGKAPPPWPSDAVHHAGEVMYCAACSSKPGATPLCSSCLHNRDLIAALARKVRIAELEEELRKLRSEQR